MVQAREQMDMWSTMVNLIHMMLENIMVGLDNMVKTYKKELTQLLGLQHLGDQAQHGGPQHKAHTLPISKCMA